MVKAKVKAKRSLLGVLICPITIHNAWGHILSGIWASEVVNCKWGEGSMVTWALGCKEFHQRPYTSCWFIPPADLAWRLAMRTVPRHCGFGWVTCWWDDDKPQELQREAMGHKDMQKVPCPAPINYTFQIEIQSLISKPTPPDRSSTPDRGSTTSMKTLDHTVRSFYRAFRSIFGATTTL